jgi:hypothetical protein
MAERIRQKVLQLYQQHYGDFGPTLASEKLRERHKISLHAETLRLWLRQAQLPYRRRKARPHRQWRPRRSCFGMMVQLDGSHHDWLEGRGPKLVLMGIIDDATNRVEARFYDMRGRFRPWIVFGVGSSATGFRPVCIWTSTPPIDPRGFQPPRNNCRG